MEGSIAVASHGTTGGYNVGGVDGVVIGTEGVVV